VGVGVRVTVGIGGGVGGGVGGAARALGADVSVSSIDSDAHEPCSLQRQLTTDVEVP